MLKNYPYPYIDLMVSAPLNETYWGVIPANHNHHYIILTMCIVRPHRNLYVNPLTLESTWDPPQLSALDETFEGSFFPPSGWQNNSAGIGWFRTENGSSTTWQIPLWNSLYACSNDSLIGNFNNGSIDYLINPGLDLRHKDDYRMTFNSYFDGSNGQKAYIEYCYPDNLWVWDTLHHMTPYPYWQELEIDLSGFSGPGTELVWLAFHSDDQGGDGSGWAVDNVRVFSPDPPSPVLNYRIFIDDQLVGITEDTHFQLPSIPYGEEHTVCVKALYFGGISSGDYFTFISMNLFPPSCFYQADTGSRPLIVCPPLDSNGLVYYNHIGYNLYRDGSIVCYLTPETTSFHPYECDYLPTPGVYAYTLTAIFDLTPYGFPGETGESSEILSIYTYSNGFSLPFTEDWSSGNFDDNLWDAEGPNWAVISQGGNPAPSAEFSWDPIQTDYSWSLESYPLLGDSLAIGSIKLKFDVTLMSYLSTGAERLIVEVWNWQSQTFYPVDTSTNAKGGFNWTRKELDITEHAIGQVFKIRFRAEGENSLHIIYWRIDNLEVYRECEAPHNLIINYLQYNAIVELSWDPPSNGGYNMFAVYRSDNGCPFFFRDFTIENSYIDEVCMNGVYFWSFKVKAIYSEATDYCESEFSNEDFDVCEGIFEISENIFLNIYPNPARDIIRVESPEILDQITVYNAYGKLLRNFQTDRCVFDIPVHNFPPGVYLIKGHAGNQMFPGKFIVH